MIGLVVALSYSGIVALYLAMPRHYRELFNIQPTRRQTLGLRSIGWLLLSAAFAPAISADGWQMGPVLWIATLSVTATLFVIVLPYWRRPLLTIPLWLLPATLLSIPLLR